MVQEGGSDGAFRRERKGLLYALPEKLSDSSPCRASRTILFVKSVAYFRTPRARLHQCGSSEILTQLAPYVEGVAFVLRQ
jgi:hypothetical protein